MIVKNVFFSVLVLLLVACGGGGGDGGPPPTTAPKINDVRLFQIDEYNYPTQTLSFTKGDAAKFEIYCSDPDCDIVQLVIELWHPANIDNPYDTAYIDLPTITQPDAVFFPIDPLIIEWPAATWKLVFYLIDSAGNESNMYTIYAVVHEP